MIEHTGEYASRHLSVLWSTDLIINQNLPSISFFFSFFLGFGKMFHSLLPQQSQDFFFFFSFYLNMEIYY